MNKDIISQEEVISESYMSRKGLTYEQLNTKAEDWHVSKVIGYLPNMYGIDVPVYEHPKGYIQANTRFSQPTSVMSRYTSCHLCGHGIRVDNIHFIQNDKAKLYMQVGCECVHNSYGKVVRKIVKQFKMNDLRKEFGELREKATLLLNSFVDVQESYSNDYNCYALRTQRLEAWAYEMKTEIERIEIEKAGERKLKNRIESMKKLLEQTKPKVISKIQIREEVKNLKSFVRAYEEGKEELEVQFGKYKGKKIGEVDDGYYKWAKEQVEEQNNGGRDY